MPALHNIFLMESLIDQDFKGENYGNKARNWIRGLM